MPPRRRESLANLVDAHAARAPEARAYLSGAERLSWADYARESDRLAGVLAGLGLEAGERVGVLLPDGPGVHVAYVGAEKAGLVVMGIGPRAGSQEVRHLLEVSGATTLISRAEQRGTSMTEQVETLRGEGLPIRHHLIWERLPEADARPCPRGRRLSPDDLFLLNSTSGTTGLPKCVTHDQRRWYHFHELAVEAGELHPGDVFLSALPAPFGFGLWTGHVTPTLLGAPTVLLESFSAERLLAEIERHRVSVLAAVSTQFILMLESADLEKRDLSSLRVLFTGGEAVPFERAAEFEERTGASVLQFYGSNETGALSRTTTHDSRDRRLRTAGGVIESMNVRLFDDRGRDVTATGRGQPACRGPLTSRGYWNDEAANAKLYTPDGWMLTGDVATLDAEGTLTVVGRVADFIIRGGKNISGPAVEEAVAGHPSVALAAAVAMPDPVFGERVCAYVELRPGASLTLEELTSHLASQGISREWFPERLVVLDELPRSSGGKVAKQRLREDIRRRMTEEAAA